MNYPEGNYSYEECYQQTPQPTHYYGGPPQMGSYYSHGMFPQQYRNTCPPNYQYSYPSNYVNPQYPTNWQMQTNYPPPPLNYMGHPNMLPMQPRNDQNNWVFNYGTQQQIFNQFRTPFDSKHPNFPHNQLQFSHQSRLGSLRLEGSNEWNMLIIPSRQANSEEQYRFLHKIQSILKEKLTYGQKGQRFNIPTHIYQYLFYIINRKIFCSLIFKTISLLYQLESLRLTKIQISFETQLLKHIELHYPPALNYLEEMERLNQVDSHATSLLKKILASISNIHFAILLKGSQKITQNSIQSMVNALLISQNFRQKKQGDQQQLKLDYTFEQFLEKYVEWKEANSDKNKYFSSFKIQKIKETKENLFEKLKSLLFMKVMSNGVRQVNGKQAEDTEILEFMFEKDFVCPKNEVDEYFFHQIFEIWREMFFEDEPRFSKKQFYEIASRVIRFLGELKLVQKVYCEMRNIQLLRFIQNLGNLLEINEKGIIEGLK